VEADVAVGRTDGAKLEVNRECKFTYYISAYLKYNYIWHNEKQIMYFILPLLLEFQM
jgi:hypothetical protein